MRAESVPPRAARPPVRRLSAGAEVAPGGVHFRVWAPSRRTVDVRVESGTPGLHPLAPEGGGWFSGLVAGLREGARYRYRLDAGDAFPDPASRFQPEARTILPRWWTRPGSRGPTPAGRGSVPRARCGTSCTSGRSRRRARFRIACSRGGRLRLTLRPGVHFRPHEAAVSAPLGSYRLLAEGGCYEISQEGGRFPPLRIVLHGRRPAFTVEEERLAEVVYRIEGSRGHDQQGDP